MSLSLKKSESWKLGIKLQFLIDWSKQQGFTISVTTRELLLSRDTAEFVGYPRAFISHAWDYRFLEVLEALISYFRDEEDVIIWFDIFSNNQHKTASLDFEWWSETFKNAILSFGRTVMVLAPWNDPLPLQRGWCIWELYCTIEGKRSIKFDVAMSAGSVEQFIADVNADPINVMNKMLATIDTSKSECFKTEDKERIHEAIGRTVGFDELNKEIFEVMRGWMIAKYEARYEQLEGHCDVKTLATFMHNLSILYMNQGEIGKAVTLSEEYFRMMEASFGLNDHGTLNCMNNLASLYKSQGKNEKALPISKDCYSSMKVLLGEDHPDTLRSMGTLADLYCNVGEFGKALPLYKDCLRIRKLKLGYNDPDALTSMNNLAIFHENQGEYDKALPLYEECLRLRKVVLGENHPDILDCMSNLAGLYSKLGENGKALSMFEECLRVNKVLFGVNHPTTLNYMNNLAVDYLKQGEYGKALPLLEGCLKTSEEINGGKHPNTLSFMSNLASLYHNQKEYGNALMLLEKCWRIRDEELGNKHPDTLTSIYNLAYFYDQQREYAKALPLYEESLRMRKDVLGFDAEFNGFGYNEGEKIGRPSHCLKNALG